LLFLDLNHFKAVNDNHGHAMGDLLLKAVAQRTHRQVRDADLVARLGRR
jgi:diguanylate cyclase (GGDEF)-like protein